MNIKQNIDYWLKSAAHDLDVAETLFRNQKYDWCLFIGHPVIEKTLKAFYVRDKQEMPPKIHNLLRLAENTKLALDKEQLQFLAEVNRFMKPDIMTISLNSRNYVRQSLPSNNFQK